MDELNQRYFVIGYDVPATVYGPIGHGNETQDYLNLELNKTEQKYAPCRLTSTFFMDARSASVGKRLMVVWERLETE